MPDERDEYPAMARRKLSDASSGVVSVLAANLAILREKTPELHSQGAIAQKAGDIELRPERRNSGFIPADTSTSVTGSLK